MTEMHGSMTYVRNKDTFNRYYVHVRLYIARKPLRPYIVQCHAITLHAVKKKKNNKKKNG